MSVITLAICMVAFALSAVAIGYSYGAANAQPAPIPVAPVNQVTRTPEPEVEPEPEEILIDGYIAIPGFERLTADKGVINSSGIGNPAKNDCYIIVSIIMPDGQEVYHSGILAPGQMLDTITLGFHLDPGIYDEVIARYSCYAIDTMQPLNGADINFTLEVLP